MSGTPAVTASTVLCASRHSRAHAREREREGRAARPFGVPLRRRRAATLT